MNLAECDGCGAKEKRDLLAAGWFILCQPGGEWLDWCPTCAEASKAHLAAKRRPEPQTALSRRWRWSR